MMLSEAFCIWQFAQMFNVHADISDLARTDQHGRTAPARVEAERITCKTWLAAFISDNCQPSLRDPERLREDVPQRCLCC